jgi:hypothetical protein
MTQAPTTKSAESGSQVTQGEHEWPVVTGPPEFGNHQFTGDLGQFSGALADLRDARDEALIRPFGSTVFPQPTDEYIRTEIERLVPKDAEDGAKIDNWDVPVYNQQPLRSCVSCAVSSVIQYLDPPASQDIAPSRLFLYYNSRALEGSQADPHVGTGIRTAIKALQKFGICEEEDWRYDPQHTAIEAPGPDTYQQTRYAGRVEYRRVFRRNSDDPPDRLAPIRRAITNGHPVLCGFTVYPSFAKASEPGFVVELPNDEDAHFVSKVPGAPLEHALLRNSTFGHCAVIIGYDGERFTLVNSWGTGWGNAGRFIMPAAYLADYGLTSDFWVITSLNKPPSEEDQPSSEQAGKETSATSD